MPLRKLLLIADITFVLVFIVNYIVFISPRKNLERFLTQLSTVEVGRTTLDEWQKRMDAARISNLKLTCNQGGCASSLQVENEILERLHLAPRSVVLAETSFTDRVASEVDVWFEIDSVADWNGAKHAGPGATVRQLPAQGSCDPRLRLNMNDRSSFHWATVVMYPCASPEDRFKALSINTRCLTRIGGCKSGEEILPQLF